MFRISTENTESTTFWDRAEGEDQEQANEWPSTEQIAKAMKQVEALTATGIAKIEADWEASR